MWVKYNWFHKEQHRPFKEDAFNQANLYYNKEEKTGRAGGVFGANEV